MSYWQQYFHIVWATYQRKPLLTPEVEEVVYRVVAAEAARLGGHAYIVNGVLDHLHTVVSIPPTLSTADFVKHLKGSSSHFVTHELGKPFRWQAGYGVFTISKGNLLQAVEYVRCQKQHHEAGEIIEAFERVSADDDVPRALTRKS